MIEIKDKNLNFTGAEIMISTFDENCLICPTSAIQKIVFNGKVYFYCGDHLKSNTDDLK